MIQRLTNDFMMFTLYISSSWYVEIESFSINFTLLIWINFNSNSNTHLHFHLTVYTIHSTYTIISLPIFLFFCFFYLRKYEFRRSVNRFSKLFIKHDVFVWFSCIARLMLKSPPFPSFNWNDSNKVNSLEIDTS